MTTPFRNTRIEFHILQSFPVTCLNRDDVGAPQVRHRWRCVARQSVIAVLEAPGASGAA